MLKLMLKNNKMSTVHHKNNISAKVTKVMDVEKHNIKVIVHPKMKIVIIYTPNSCWKPLTSIVFHSMEVRGYRQLFVSQNSSEYLILCSTEERNS